jgi:CRP-like cAMP-binding protein
MKDFENKHLLTRTGGRTAYRNAETAPAARLPVEESLSIKREYKSPKPIPFNGLLTNKLLASLPGAEFARLLPHLEPVSLTSGQALYKFGAEVDFVYFPETAIISHLYFLEDGSTTGAAIVGKEGIIGLSALLGSRPPSYWTHVTVGGSAIRVLMDTIKQEFARGAALQNLLLSYTSTRLVQLSQRAVCNVRHTVEERLATWLLMIDDRTSDEQLPLTHEEIAHHLGARRAGITTACNALRDSEIIDYHRGLIRILDRQRLEESACECYGTLRQTSEKPLTESDKRNVR